MTAGVEIPLGPIEIPGQPVLWPQLRSCPILGHFRLAWRLLRVVCRHLPVPRCITSGSKARRGWVTGVSPRRVLLGWFKTALRGAVPGHAVAAAMPSQPLSFSRCRGPKGKNGRKGGEGCDDADRNDN